MCLMSGNGSLVDGEDNDDKQNLANAIGRLSVRFSVALAGMFILVLSLSLPVVSHGDGNGKIRMYKLNKKKQLVKLNWIKGGGEMVCVNSKKRRDIHRFAQIGYEFCQLFAEKDCEAGTEVTAMWTGKKLRNTDIDISRPQTKLLQGSEWITHPEKNTAIRSWFCSYN